MRSRLNGIIQQVYITWQTFFENDLFTYASAGAYSFLLSALPMVLMVLLILIRILHTSPELIRDLLAENSMLNGSVDISRFVESITSIKSVGIFELIVGFSIFWMARRFFASIQQGIRVIYRKRGKGKPIKENLIVIAGEAILVILIVALAIFMIAGNAFFRTLIPASLMTPFVNGLLRNLFRFMPIAMIAIFLFLVYFFTPRSRPRARLSLAAAALCTLTFSVVQLAFGSFVNMSRYNLVYGILSNVVVTLFEVYVFFFLMLFFAQFQYVVQFFESFLIAQVYLLPRRDDPDPLRQIQRMMFVEPMHFYRRYAVPIRKGEVIFSQGDDSTDLYYVWEGLVRLTMPNQVIELGKGATFGEFSSIIGGTRTATATAFTDAQLLRIPAELFRETIEVNGAISRRTLRMITDYVKKSGNFTLFTDSEV